MRAEVSAESRPKRFGRAKVKGHPGETRPHGKRSSEQNQDAEQERERRSVSSRLCSVASSAIAAASIFHADSER